MISIDRIVPVNRGENVNNIKLLPKYVSNEETYGINKELNSNIEPFPTGSAIMNNAYQPTMIAGVSPCIISSSLNLVKTSPPPYVPSEYGQQAQNIFKNRIVNRRPLPPLTNAM